MRQPFEHHSTIILHRARLARRVLAASIVAAFGHAPGLALAQSGALPTGMQVTNGTAQLSVGGTQMTIANSHNAVLDWQSFSIGAGNGVRFEQANASSKVLNRVVGNDPSSILGSLSSNGEVWLVNPNGVLFGAGARIDVGALVASTLGVRNEDFLAGRHRFNGDGAAAGSVVNQGALSTSFGGRVWLVGGAVRNEGAITAPGGQIVLAAGQSIELVDSGMPNVTVRVSAPDNHATNLGSLLAPDGGSIDLHGAIVNQRGIVRADSLDAGSAGRVVIRAHGEVQLANGSITSADGDGRGAVLVSGANVRLDGAQLQTDGAIRVDAATSIDLVDANLDARAEGDGIVLSAPSLTASGSRLGTPNGRWLVYLDRVDGPAQASQLDQLGYTFMQVGAAAGGPLPAADIGRHGVVMRDNLDVRIHVDADRSYDGSTRATVSRALSSDLPAWLALEKPSASYQGNFTDKHAGAGKRIDYRGVSPLFGIVTATGQSVYGARQTYVADVARANLSVTGAVVQDKVYDGTRAASVYGGLAGVVAGDSVRLDGATGLFADKNAGVGKPVTISGGVLAGADARNYSLAGSAATGRATITPRVIGAGGLAAQDKAYDGTRVATLSGSLSGILAGDDVTLTNASGLFADKNAGADKLVSLDGVTLGGADARNYTLSAPAGVRATITPRALTAAGLAVQDKIYDGTRDAEVSATLAGALAGDAVSLEIAGQFDTGSAGTGKAVAITGGLRGADAANYVLALPAAAAATIHRRALQIVIDGALRKEYDATTTIDLAPGAFALTGVVAGDTLAVRGPAQGQFDSPDAGSGKRVMASGLFEVLGADAANYRIGATSLDAGANRVDATAVGNGGAITPATLVYHARPGVVVGALDVGDLGGTVTGFKGNDTLANATSGTLQWHTTATPASMPGAHPIFGSGLSAANYVLVQAPGNAGALAIKAGLPAGGPLQRAQDGAALAIASALEAALPAACSAVRVWPQCNAVAASSLDQ